MKHSFSISFTDDEVACLVSIYSRNYIDKIDCGKFLNEFFRLISENNTKNRRNQVHITEKCNQNERTYLDNIIEKMAYSTPINMREARINDIQSAFTKFSNISSYHKPDIFNNFKKYFDGIDLTPTLFHKFLSNNFQIDLNSGELDAAIGVFDLNKDGAISYVEFMSTFYLLGIEERSRRLIKQKNAEKFIITKRKEKILKRFDAFKKDVKSHISWPVLPSMNYDENDYENEKNELYSSPLSASQSRRISRISSPGSPSFSKTDKLGMTVDTKVNTILTVFVKHL